MSKKVNPTLDVRRPSERNPDEFVRGMQANQLSTANIQQSTVEPIRRTKGLVRRADGQELRRITVYLEPSVAKKLVTYCFEQELQVSDVAAHAIHDHLNRLETASG